MTNCNCCRVQLNLIHWKQKSSGLSQTQYVDRAEFGELTALLEYVTILLKYLDVSILVQKFEGPRPALGNATE